jgi:alkylation response protein AidB-like acyl-CoA dehydrogenase
MEWLAAERKTLEAFIPGLDAGLAGLPLLELEAPGNVGLRLYRQCTGPSFLIPRAYSGRGATPVEAIQVHRALGSRSPSLAVATTMHQFSVMTLAELCRQRKGTEALLLEGVARQNLLVASGFAEGRSGCGILSATMRARRTPAGFIVNGSKKPCSLSRSMDLLTASATVEQEGGRDSFTVLMVPARSRGIERRDFWNNPVLAGAESDEVILTDVNVPERLAFVTQEGGDLDSVQVNGFLWFELLIAASYQGMASALVERVVARNRGTNAERVFLGTELEGAMAALEAIARQMMAGPTDRSVLARMLFVRYAVQGAVMRASDVAVELLGGIEFVRSSEVTYLYSACRALAFHPPSRASMCDSLSEYLHGGQFNLA